MNLICQECPHATDRKQLIRKASELPVGSKERRSILADLSKSAVTKGPIAFKPIRRVVPVARQYGMGLMDVKGVRINTDLYEVTVTLGPIDAPEDTEQIKAAQSMLEKLFPGSRAHTFTNNASHLSFDLKR